MTSAKILFKSNVNENKEAPKNKEGDNQSQGAQPSQPQ